MKNSTFSLSIVSLAIVGFLFLSLDFDFYQDDAYISYRYVANYIDGHGLVFNLGERVEGYTNFGWVLMLLAGGVLGLPYMILSKLVGVALGAASIFVTFLIGQKCFEDDRYWFALLPVCLLGANLSLAYWSQAGLETAAFVFLTALSLYYYLQRDYLLVATITMAVLVRPEGALLAGMFIVIEAITDRRLPRFALVCAAIAFVLSLPFVIFKLIYFGSILPNPFYAKTGFDLAQLTAGLEYAGRFFKHYAFLAVGLVGLPIFWTRLNRSLRTVWLFAVLYVLYIVLIGGDVLKVHRFFLPVLVPATIVLAALLMKLTARLNWKTAALGLFVITLSLVTLTQYVPYDFIDYYTRAEKALLHKMSFLARKIKANDRSDFTVATSTIGIFSYELLGHRVIDMLGLTDSTIARHPGPPLVGMESTWKERGHNSAYLLEQAPDYIAFSTGMKPSAPAERALMVYPQFLDCYRGVSWHYMPPGYRGPGGELPAYRRTCEPEPPFVPVHPLEFVNNYNRGTNAHTAGRHEEAAEYFNKALELGGDPPYVYLLYKMSLNYFQLKQFDLGEQIQNDLIARDSTLTEVHSDLYLYEFTAGNREKAAVHRSWLAKLAPWKLPRYDSLAAYRARVWKERSAGTQP